MFDPDQILKTELIPKVPGLSAAAAVDGKLVWSRQHGLADLRAKLPVDRQTRFRIGSVSKPLTLPASRCWSSKAGWNSMHPFKSTSPISLTKAF
jgi:hypothetical protein